MIKFKEFILREGVTISNKEKLEMWDKVQRGEIREDEFLKSVEFEKFNPNSKLGVHLSSGDDFHIGETFQGRDIHTKSFYGEIEGIDVRERWREFDSKGNQTKMWDNKGNSEENKNTIDDKGRLKETKITIGQGKLIVKQIRIYDKEDTRNRNLLHYYYEEADGVKDERKYEYKYDDKQREIYKKEIFVLDNKVKETVREYWDNNYVKDVKEYENGKLTKEESYTRNGDRKLPERLTKIAEKRAEEYNRKYHGIFVHSTNIIGLKNLLKIKYSNKKSEICISTLRANTVFQSGANNVVIVGFGNIKELYNYDSYSEREKDGSRYATKATDDDDDINLHSKRKDHIEGYDETLHYDEGFMDFSKADVVAVFADYSKVIDEWVNVDDDIISKKELPHYYKAHKMYRPNVDTRKIKVRGFKTFIKKLNPNIKVIELSKFNSLQNSEELMKLMYRLKDEGEGSEIMNEPLYPYEEKTKFKTFKKFIMENQNDYKGEHTAPDSESGAPAYDLTMNGIYPKDVYNMPSWYESEEGLDEMYKILRLKGRADGPVWIHRAIPMEVYKKSEGMRLLNRGDWVTTSKQYAKDHGESLFKDAYKIISKRVRASEIFTNGDSIMEWGYYPT